MGTKRDKYNDSFFKNLAVLSSSDFLNSYRNRNETTNYKIAGRPI